MTGTKYSYTNRVSVCYRLHLYLSCLENPEIVHNHGGQPSADTSIEFLALKIVLK